MESRIRNSPTVSNHIFVASCSLFGLCFILLSLIAHFGTPDKTLIDDLSAVAAILFLLAGTLSYCSLRFKKGSDLWERIGEIFFLVGLVFLSIVALSIVAGVLR